MAGTGAAPQKGALSAQDDPCLPGLQTAASPLSPVSGTDADHGQRETAEPRGSGFLPAHLRLYSDSP